MRRKLCETEKVVYIKNRDMLHSHLSELQADFEDFDDTQLLECRDVMKNRIDECLKLILETDEDNL